jgi:hypothetical protein
MILYSMMKPTFNGEKELEMQRVSTSQTLQIGGRAGRYGTQFQEGEVTTFQQRDLTLLKEAFNTQLEPLQVGGGIGRGRGGGEMDGVGGRWEQRASVDGSQGMEWVRME